MTKKPKTHVAIVLDRSSSMHGQREKAVEGYNEHVQQLKIDAKDQDIFFLTVGHGEWGRGLLLATALQPFFSF